MEFSEKEVEYIYSHLESLPVTYHTASRDLGLSVGRSKRLLAQIYQSKKSSLHACFIATGRRQDKLVVHRFEGESDLESTVNLVLDEVFAVHIYSLRLERTVETSVEVALEELRHPILLSEVDKFHKLGLIMGPEIVQSVASPLLPTPQAETNPSKHHTGLPSGTSKDDKRIDDNSKSDLVYRSNKPAAKTSLLSNYISRKGEGRSTSNKRPTPEQNLAYQYKSRKIERSEPKERVVISNVLEEDENDDLEKHYPDKQQLLSTSSELNNLFLDDDFTEDESDSKSLKPPAQGESQSITLDEDGEAESKQLQNLTNSSAPENFSQEEAISLSTEKPTGITEESQPPKETIVDEDGYFTLYKKVEPESKTSAPTKVANPAAKASKSTHKGDGKKRQASLMSFFGQR